MRKIDKSLVVPADDQRQLIDAPYGAMIEMEHAGNDALAHIDATLGK